LLTKALKAINKLYIRTLLELRLTLRGLTYKIGAEKLLNFPVLILEDVIDALRKCMLSIEF